MVTDAELVRGAVVFSIGVSALCILGALLALVIYRPRSAEAPQYLREVPDDIPLVIIGALGRRGLVGDAEIAATLLDLTAQGELTARPVRRRITGIMGGAEINTLEFAVAEGGWERMAPLERELFTMLTETIGGHGGVGIAELKAAARARTRALRRGIARWQASVDGHAETLGLLRRSARIARWALITAAVVALVLGALSSMVASGLEPLAATAIGAVVSLGAAFALSPLTADGARILAHYHAFERYLSDFGTLEDDPPASVILWNRYLAYATLFGIADRSLAALDMRLPALAGMPDFEPFRAWIAAD
ncbi:MAG: DUF2207 domain-containing protein [Coriobacteriia bacterium]|nr:DUF2207 domain-containing protein [Coriobacteriia bacterium]